MPAMPAMPAGVLHKQHERPRRGVQGFVMRVQNLKCQQPSFIVDAVWLLPTTIIDHYQPLSVASINHHQPLSSIVRSCKIENNCCLHSFTITTIDGEY